MRTCPRCRIVSPDSASACDCGHAFDAQGAAWVQSAQSGRPPNLRGPGVFAKIGACFVGYICGAFPVAVMGQILEMNGRGLATGGPATRFSRMNSRRPRRHRSPRLPVAGLDAPMDVDGIRAVVVRGQSRALF
jgi:hypothetical protein